MAQLILRPDEPHKLFDLLEKLTGVDMSKPKSMLDGLTLAGNITVNQKMKDGDVLTVAVTFSDK